MTGNSGWGANLSYPKLAKLLRQQADAGLVKVVDTTDGLSVRSLDGETAIGVHQSVLKDGAKSRSVQNLIASLRRIGTLSPGEWHDYVKAHRAPAETADTAVAALFPCVECDFVGETSKGLGAHRWRSHGVEGSGITADRRRRRKEAQPTATTEGKPSAGPVRKKQQEPTDPRVKARKLAATITNSAGVLDQAAAELADLFGTLFDEHEGLKAKHKKLVDQLGRAIDEI